MHMYMYIAVHLNLGRIENKNHFVLSITVDLYIDTRYLNDAFRRVPGTITKVSKLVLTLWL